MQTKSTEIQRRAEEASRNRSRLANYYATRSARTGRPVPVHSAHRHLVKRSHA